MTALKRFAKRLAATLRRRTNDDGRVRDELAEHLALLTEEYRRAGHPSEEAHRLARIRLGAPDVIAEAYRDEQRLGWLETLASDVRFGIRALRRNPGFSIVAIFTLALGMGANLAIFTLVNAVLIRPLPYRDPGELTLVHLLMPERGSPDLLARTIWSYPKYDVVRSGQQVFTSTSLFADREWSLTKAGTPERLQGEVVEAPYFTLLGVDARVGRLFSASDDRIDSTPVAVISHGLWQRRLGGTREVLGRPLMLDGVSLTIVGVAPPGFRGLSGRADVWRPLKPTEAAELAEAGSHSYHMIARRTVGVSIEQADAAVRALGPQIDSAFPNGKTTGRTSVSAVSLEDERLDPLLRRGAYLLLGAVGLVLLIACVNLANLTLARGLARQREIAIRVALGAGRLRIARQLFTESLLLSVTGAVAGALVAAGAIRAAATLMPDSSALLDGPAGGLTRVSASMLGADATVVLATVVLAVLSALLFGLVPAWQATRRDLAPATKPVIAGSPVVGTGNLSLRHGLQVGEVALALIMLVGAGLMVKSLVRLSQTELGFQPAHVLTFELSLPFESYPLERSGPFIEHLLNRLAERPEVEGVAFGHCAPVSDRCNGTRASFPERPVQPNAAGPLVGATWVSPGFFQTLGITIVQGRSFTDRDRQGQPKVVVISDAAARQFWPGENPIGRRIAVSMGGFKDGAEVIGVAADVRYRGVETPAGPDVYLPVLQSPRTRGMIFVRSRLSTATLVPVIRQDLASLDADLPLSDIKTMDERYGDATWRPRTLGLLLSAFAGLALMLALVGVFAVLAQSVAQRAREIAIRIALGASPRDIQRLVLGRAMAIAAAGVVAGLAGAWFASRLLTTFLYEVEPTDPAVLSAIAVLLFLVTLVASAIPALRAAHIDPLEIIRSE
jgi:putative ABC transport system permease protein